MTDISSESEIEIAIVSNPEVISSTDATETNTTTETNSGSPTEEKPARSPSLQQPQHPSDPWASVSIEPVESKTPCWSDLDKYTKRKKISLIVMKLSSLFLLLYFFVCSLELLSTGFKLVGGKTTGELFQQNEFLQNPIVGVMLGVLATVLLQSSSTSTSVVVSMVASDILTVEDAIPIVMGANIGTSVTNTLVALTQAGDREEFRRAFAGATVHDMFNWLSVIVLLTLEVTTGYLYYLTSAIMDSGVWETNLSSGREIKGLQVITEPLVSYIIQLNESVIQAWSLNDPSYDNASLQKIWCGIDIMVSPYNITDVLVQRNYAGKCQYLFALFNLNDVGAGIIIIIAAILILCSCLIVIVKLLHSMLKGKLALIIKKTLNANIPYVPWITGYIALIIGALMTMLVQSSSVFTSALTPLVGIGIISLDRMYPLTLGSNIGTTTTSLLAAASVDPAHMRPAIQIALCHLFFNLSGILLFYPVPFMRLPIPLARILGNITAKYRWFAVAYVLLMFLVLPACVMALSIAGPIYMLTVGLPICVVFAVVVLINVLQRKVPICLPPCMRTWNWLPQWMHSLQPFDSLITNFSCCKTCGNKPKSEESDGQVNPAFESQHN